MSTSNTLKQNDRISFSGKAQGGTYHLSYSTDVMDGETAAEAMARARRFVEEQARLVETESHQALPRPNPAPVYGSRAPSRDLFDPTNPIHLQHADLHFDKFGFNDKRRSFYVWNFLKDQPLGDVGRIIADEVESFKRTSGRGRSRYQGRAYS